jgi:translation initiation factor IF-3
MDLVEISPNAEPPVCRIMDYGKFRFEENKKLQTAKKKQKQTQVKEIKFRPGTDIGDYNIKLRKLISFLEDGDRTKVTLRFRGREMAHQELGMQLLMRVKTDLDEYGTVEQEPKMEGRLMVMVLAPRRNK